MKPIKRGMTEAVTRDGRKVTQLTWFDGVKSIYCLRGVLEDGSVQSWLINGKYSSSDNESNLDIFAPVEYEWQWLVRWPDGFFDVTGFYRTEEAAKKCTDWQLIRRIEESKREVK